MVRLYILSGEMMKSRDMMHDQLYMVFGFPTYYGRNLDALWDCLGDAEPGVVLLQHMEKADTDCLLSLTRVFTDLVRSDPKWELRFSTGDPDCHAHGADPAECGGDCAHCSAAENCEEQR